MEDVEAGNNDIKWARISREGDFEAECTMWLDPRRFNLHQIQANNEIGCALLDIMIPPYDKYVAMWTRAVVWNVVLMSCLLCFCSADRDCHHYEILADRILAQTQQRVVKMLESVQPDNHNGPNGSSTQR